MQVLRQKGQVGSGSTKTFTFDLPKNSKIYYVIFEMEVVPTQSGEEVVHCISDKVFSGTPYIKQGGVIMYNYIKSALDPINGGGNSNESRREYNLHGRKLDSDVLFAYINNQCGSSGVAVQVEFEA